MQLDTGLAHKTINQNSLFAIKQLNDKSFFRTETIFYLGQTEAYLNSFSVMNLKGVSIYYSLANPYVSQFLTELDYFRSPTDFSYESLDSRTMLDAITNVKYFLLIDGFERHKSFGFNKRVSEYVTFNNIKYVVYENDYFIPFGYTHDGYITRKNFDSLTVIEKQQAFMQAVVLEEKLEDMWSMPENLSFRQELLSFPISKVAGDVTNDLMYIPLKSLPNSESYIKFNNLIYKNYENKFRSGLLNVDTGNLSKSVYINTLQYPYSIGRKNYIINLGYNKEKIDSVNISFFNTPSTKFFLDSIEIIFLPMGDKYIKETQTLKQDHLENVLELNNEIRGTISLETNKILFLSIPYSKGWTAFVNAVKTPILRANIAFMALPLKAGEHEIRLKYITPGLKLGLLVSLFGWILFLFVILKRRK
jgi:uncharacterized membrane protein YfhO